VAEDGDEPGFGFAGQLDFGGGAPLLAAVVF
jgi:hypothetical protein